MLEKDKVTAVRERDAHLVRLIEAITATQSTSAWSTLKEEFDGEVARLNRLLLAESKKKDVDLPEVYRLQGRIEEAKKLSLEKLFDDFMTERDTIRRKLS